METAIAIIEEKKKAAVVEHEGPKFHVVRMVEALIIGAICAGVTMWGTQLVVGEKITNLADRQMEFQREIKTELLKIRNDFYRPIYHQNGSK
jgi:hypothetical protein